MEQLSLSVEVDNYANTHYTDLDFVVVEEAGGAVTMARSLD